MGPFPFPASRERQERIRNRAHAAFAADADRRWLLALGQNESEEAASHPQQKSPDDLCEKRRSPNRESERSEFSEVVQGK